MTFRNAVPILDFEGVRLSKNTLDPIRVVCVQGITGLMGQFCIFQLWDGNCVVNMVTIMVNQSVICLGIIVMGENNL
jgi:hypothetical protein